MNTISRLISIMLAAACCLQFSAAAAQDVIRKKWPTYYYGDPAMRSVADEAILAVTRSTLLRIKFRPETSVLIITGELVSGPDYCIAVLRITAQGTRPPYRSQSSAGSSHAIFNGVQGACPGEHDSEAADLAIQEFLGVLREEVNSGQ